MGPDVGKEDGRFDDGELWVVGWPVLALCDETSMVVLAVGCVVPATSDEEKSGVGMFVVCWPVVGEFVGASEVGDCVVA